MATEVKTEEREEIGISIEEPESLNLSKQSSIRIVEFGKLPTTILIAEGKTAGDLKSEGLLSKTVDVYVNGVVVGDDYIIQDGDAVVGSPRVAGGK